jgi:hypothetical protein
MTTLNEKIWQENEKSKLKKKYIYIYIQTPKPIWPKETYNQLLYEHMTFFNKHVNIYIQIEVY